MKRPFRPSLFSRVAAIVQTYTLDMGFVDELAASLALDAFGALHAYGAAGKSPLEPPLFALVSESQARIARAIMESVSNPYLDYANSPSEILLCNHLFVLNPGIEPELLKKHHFATLLESVLGGLEQSQGPG